MFLWCSLVRFECGTEIYRMTSDCDPKLAALLSGLPGQSLKSFTTFSRVDFGAESSLALNCHAKSLTNLELQLTNDAIPHMGFLKGCTALETLKLTDIYKTVDLEKTQHDVFLEVVSWLTESRNLNSLVLNGFISGAALATPVLL